MKQPAIVGLLVFVFTFSYLGSVPQAGASEQQPLWSYQTNGRIESVAISSDGSYIVAGNADGTVYFFSKNSSTPALELQSWLLGQLSFDFL